MGKKKKIAIIGIAGLPANYGGFETLTDHLIRKKNDEFDFFVFCGKTPKGKRLKTYNGASLIYLPFNANGAQSIIYDIIAIIKSWFKFDTLLILGTSGCTILPFLRILKKTNTVINFGGLEWKREKWNTFTKKYLKITESIAVKYATNFVVDNQHFRDYVKEEYEKESKVIEYGGDHVAKLPVTNELIKRFPFLSGDFAISVSRAQADNNLHILLEAYSKTPDKILVLISNWESFDYGRILKKQYTIYSNLFLIDAIYDLSILDVLRSNAKIYIHSHTFCGTAPSLVEAMSLGLPIVSYLVPTNLETTEGKAIFFSSLAELMNIINHTSDETFKTIGSKMKEIADRRYNWGRISSEYAKLF